MKNAKKREKREVGEVGKTRRGGAAEKMGISRNAATRNITTIILDAQHVAHCGQPTHQPKTHFDHPTHSHSDHPRDIHFDYPVQSSFWPSNAKPCMLSKPRCAYHIHPAFSRFSISFFCWVCTALWVGLPKWALGESPNKLSVGWSEGLCVKWPK